MALDNGVGKVGRSGGERGFVFFWGSDAARSGVSDSLGSRGCHLVVGAVTW